MHASSASLSASTFDCWVLTWLCSESTWAWYFFTSDFADFRLSLSLSSVWAAGERQR